MKIYIVEDDKTLREELARILDFQGYAVELCNDFPQAAQLALASGADLAILDLRLPGNDGLMVCRQIRAASSMPILVVTSSDSEFDEVTSMNLGADDYISKPYSPAVLLAHVDRLLKRAYPAAAAPLSYEGLLVDLARSEVSYKGHTAKLANNELRILSSLVRARGAIVSRQNLMFELWQSDEFIDDNTLTVNVNRLRKALSKLGTPDDILKTHRGQGYSL